MATINSASPSPTTCPGGDELVTGVDVEMVAGCETIGGRGHGECHPPDRDQAGGATNRHVVVGDDLTGSDSLPGDRAAGILVGGPSRHHCDGNVARA